MSSKIYREQMGVACPACKQPAGEPCIKANGRRLGFDGGQERLSDLRHHAARQRAARRA